MNNDYILWDRSESGIIPEGCKGLIVDASGINQQLFLNNAERLPKSKILLNEHYDNADYKEFTDKFEKLKYPIEYYLDEYFSNPKLHKDLNQAFIDLGNKDLKLIYGEPDISNFRTLADNEEITYTAYHPLVCEIFGIRIYNYFRNQIKEWERLEEKYGIQEAIHFGDTLGMVTAVTVTANPRTVSKFNFVWISLNKNKNDYKVLVDWAKLHNKQVMVFVDSGTSKETFLRLLDKFNKAV